MKTTNTKRQCCIICEEIIDSIEIQYNTTKEIEWSKVEIKCSQGHANTVYFRDEE